MTTDPDILVEARTALNDIVEQTPMAPEWQELDAGLQRLDVGRPPRRWNGAAVALLAAAAALVTIGAIALVGLSQAPGDVASSPAASAETTESLDLAPGADPESGSSVALVERDGLVLTLRGPLDSQCLEVRSETGMSGGCGLDLSQPLSLAAGGLAGTNFISGWATENAVRVVVTLAGGAEIEVTDLVAVEGINRRFFMELIPPNAAGDVNASGELNLPITAVALDQNDREVGRFALLGTGSAAPDDQVVGPSDDAGDGVEIDSTSERVLVSVDGLELVVSQSNIGLCLHVRLSSRTGYAGGCGFDATDPMKSWMVGGLTDSDGFVSFVAGLDPVGADSVTIRYGSESRATDVVNGGWIIVVDRGDREDVPDSISWNRGSTTQVEIAPSGG